MGRPRERGFHQLPARAELSRGCRASRADADFESCVEAYPGFYWGQFQYEDALWTLVHERPAHLLNPEFTSWDALLVAAVG